MIDEASQCFTLCFESEKESDRAVQMASRTKGDEFGAALEAHKPLVH